MVPKPAIKKIIYYIRLLVYLWNAILITIWIRCSAVIETIDFGERRWEARANKAPEVVNQTVG